jgi:DNA-directed RNA polymerase beta' subunit
LLCHDGRPLLQRPPARRCLNRAWSLAALFPCQVRKISVKQVVAPMIFDNMRTAVKGGLYDPALGPMDPKER